jgi:hypothetical protein
MGSGGFLGTVTIPAVSVIFYSMEPIGRFIVTPVTNTERRGRTVHIELSAPFCSVDCRDSFFRSSEVKIENGDKGIHGRN